MDATAHALGRLEGKVDQLITNQQASDFAGRESHKIMNDKLGSLLDRFHMMDIRLQTVENDMSEIKPFVEEARKWQQRSVGALAVFGLFSGTIGGAVVYFKERFFLWLAS